MSTVPSRHTATLGRSRELSGQIMLILTHRSSCREIPTSPSRTACSLGAGGCCSRYQSSSCSGFPELTREKTKTTKTTTTKTFKKQNERHTGGCCPQVTSSLRGCSAQQNARDLRPFPASRGLLQASPRSPDLLPQMSPFGPQLPFLQLLPVPKLNPDRSPLLSAQHPPDPPSRRLTSLFSSCRMLRRESRVCVSCFTSSSWAWWSWKGGQLPSLLRRARASSAAGTGLRPRLSTAGRGGTT